MNFRYDYGKKDGLPSTSVSLSKELRDEIDAAYGRGQRSGFLERAGWLLLGLLMDNDVLINRWDEWAYHAMSGEEYKRWVDGIRCLSGEE